MNSKKSPSQEMQWVTPNKNDIMHNIVSMRSPVSFTTPVKQADKRFKSYKNSSACFTLLPNHITPPSGLTKFVARNPFESELTNRLHLSVISPTVFTKVSDTSPESNGFSWNIDELANIQPAKIEEFPIQQPHCTDPEIEREAQDAIDRFFRGNQIIPSPWDNGEKNNFRKTDMQTPLRGYSDTAKESQSLKKDSWSQTTLSLPPNLPPHVEEILKPYFTFTQEQNVESDEANSSGNSSLRRKLFAHDDTHEDDTESSFLLSPIHSRSMIHCSPMQSGMLNHGTPLRGNSGNLRRNHGTPLAFDNMSPVNMSPISEAADEMSYDSVKSRVRTAARLDFTTDMSIDMSVREVDKLEESQKEPTDNVKNKPVEIEKHIFNEENQTIDMTMHLENSYQSKIKEKENFPPNYECDSLLKRPKFINDWSKTISSDNNCTYQQNFTLSVTSNQNSVFNSAQDTGYHTCSINNTTNNTESYTTSSIIHERFHWDEKLLPSEDGLIEWKENMKYMCSSTPSKFLRE
ncbi:protein aurora borealis [Leptopilina heterotoma]|uniref:protein aurora borealis n=1 Tax=Leptopilina heterotoma TaxID=63436 RepID=UPI001CA9B859|nr:protein aurora borealis [Leptopilina heterotoma]XP_043463276.1 protein aurora borealis [Leptopilina heterotoma]